MMQEHTHRTQGADHTDSAESTPHHHHASQTAAEPAAQTQESGHGCETARAEIARGLSGEKATSAKQPEVQTGRHGGGGGARSDVQEWGGKIEQGVGAATKQEQEQQEEEEQEEEEEEEQQ